jgi:curved DNA-binding protein CbpA
MNNTNSNKLNSDPVAKLAYLKSLLQTKGITAQQQARIYALINQTETQISQRQIPVPTRDVTPTGRALVVKQQHNNINTLSSSYTSDEARLEAEFEMELQRKREAFKLEQQRRRTEYLNKLRELEQANINSFELFGIGPNYTLEELKMAYKRLAMKSHPDRPGGNTTEFQRVTQCYMDLLEKLKTKNSGAQFNELRNSSRDANKQADGHSTGADYRDRFRDMYRTSNTEFKGSSESVKSGGSGYLRPDPKSFNRELFNKLYEQNKLWDPNDDGYDSWLRSAEVDETSKAPPVFSKAFNLSVFNSTFEDWKEKQASTSASGGQITKYDRPMELVSTGAGFMTLDGNQSIKDFTKAPDQPGSLQYTDLKLAYTGACNMINPNEVDPREQYRTVEDLELARSKISYQLSPEDMRREEARAQQLAMEESVRQERMRKHAEITAQHWNNTYQSVLGYKPSESPQAKRIEHAVSAPLQINQQAAQQPIRQLQYQQQPAAISQSQQPIRQLQYQQPNKRR